jgi:hypothetical protein
VRKIALGVVAALLLAAFPVALAGSAGADTNAQVRFINGNFTGGPAVDIYVDGVLIVKDLPPGGSFGNFFDTNAIGNGTHSLVVCVANGGLPLRTTASLTAGFCPDNGAVLGTPNVPSTVVTPSVTLSLVGGNNYTIALGTGILTNIGVPFLFVGLNYTSPTDFGFARFTLHNASVAAGPLDVCIDGDKVLSGVLPGTTQQIEVEAQQQASLQIFASAAGCLGPASTVNFVAGTNLVITVTTNFVPTCTTDCGQVLFVDQERHPNVANTSAFCAVIPTLASIQAEFKATLGGVNPEDPFTFPSAGAVKQLADDITLAITGGDFAVSNDIKPQWEVITAGLRTLVQVFKLVNYNVAGFPVVTNTGLHVSLSEIVEAANGFTLPGVPNPDLQGAITALTAWFKANCLPAATPASPAAVPASAGPRFTG